MKSKLNILIIGGTAFLGRAIVNALLAKDHQITIFHRGKTNPGIFPNVQSIIGDRDSAIEKLKGHHWDTVIDTCGYLPRIVGKSAKLLSTIFGPSIWTCIALPSKYLLCSFIKRIRSSGEEELKELR